MILSNNYIKLFNVLIAITLLQGCAGNVKLTDQDRAGVEKQKSIKVISQSSGWPGMMTPVGVVASNLTFGLSDDWTAGHKLIKKFNIKDPTLQVKDAFIKYINKPQKAGNFISTKNLLTSEESSIENLKNKYKSGVILKISPKQWAIQYFPLEWSRYLMFYGANAELIRLNDSKIIWSASCAAHQDNNETAPTLDELTANKSTVLKQWVESSTSECAKQLVDAYHNRT